MTNTLTTHKVTTNHTKIFHIPEKNDYTQTKVKHTFTTNTGKKLAHTYQYNFSEAFERALETGGEKESPSSRLLRTRTPAKRFGKKSNYEELEIPKRNSQVQQATSL